MPTRAAPGLLGQRPEGLARIGEPQESEEPHRHEDGPARGDQAGHLDERVAEHEGRPGIGHLHGAEIALPEDEGKVLEEEGQPEREQELIVLGGLTIGLDHDLLDDHAEHEEERRGQDHREVWIDPGESEEPVRRVHGQHHHRAVGEVDDAEHAEDQAEPAGHQPVHASQQQAADDGLKQEPPGHPLPSRGGETTPSTWARERPAWPRRTAPGRRPPACRSAPGSGPAWH